jgi:hypothetical protein
LEQFNRAMTAQNLYSETISTLPASEQLRLASLILKGLAESAEKLDYQDEWSDEDLRDITAYSMRQSPDEE